ncbi:hypothetical protein T08_4761 [Trichinella sp. T8]|nr:hypothetical protein T08_4761 [Trichinella sp. T8]
MRFYQRIPNHVVVTKNVMFKHLSENVPIALYNYSVLLFGSINALYHTLANLITRFVLSITANENVDEDEVALRNEMLPST